MKAVQIAAIGSPLEMREVANPSIGDDEVLVRIRAAGICHSDVHYAGGISSIGPLPHTPGHEIAGVVEEVGVDVGRCEVGDRVAIHYLVTCGDCAYCRSAAEPFCESVEMIGKDRAGGYAEYIAVPARNAIPLPDGIPFEHGAVAMCSSATVFHALRQGRLQSGERVAVFGAGGLGMSAIQLARAFGAIDVYAVDIRPERLAVAKALGAIPIDASDGDPVEAIRRATGGEGANVVLELIGGPDTMRQAVRSLAPKGRAVIVGVTDRPLEVDTYSEILGKEAEIIGSSDHLLDELPILFEFIRRGILDLRPVVTETIPLNAAEVNRRFEELRGHGPGIRTVITP